MSEPTLHKTPPAELLDHPLFSGSNSVGIMTADTPKYPAKDTGGLLSLKQHLNTLGLAHEVTHGNYGGQQTSVIVHNPTREQIYHLGHTFGQEAVIYSQNGKHELLYSNGPNQGKFHPSLPLTSYSKTQPDDYYTHIPNKGYVGLHFNLDQLHDSPVKDTVPSNRLNEPPSGPSPVPMMKSEFNQPRPWAGSYPWHESHTEHHRKHVGGGILLTQNQAAGMMPLAKSDEAKAPEPPSYEKITAPFGTTTGKPTNLKFYPMEHARGAVDQLVKDHGYTSYYHSGRHPKADLDSKNHDTFHLPIHDTGDDNHTDVWRKAKELAHALTAKDVNQKYGEGKRVGALGNRTLREAMRSVEHTHLAAHKQRQLAHKLGVTISDGDFNKEYNTHMADAVHRAILGKHSTPSEKGFVPHSHMVPLSTSLEIVKDEAKKLGLK